MVAPLPKTQDFILGGRARMKSRGAQVGNRMRLARHGGELAAPAHRFGGLINLPANARPH